MLPPLKRQFTKLPTHHYRNSRACTPPPPHHLTPAPSDRPPDNDLKGHSDKERRGRPDPLTAFLPTTLFIYYPLYRGSAHLEHSPTLSSTKSTLDRLANVTQTISRSTKSTLDRLANVTQTISRLLDGYDIRLRPNFGVANINADTGGMLHLSQPRSGAGVKILKEVKRGSGSDFSPTRANACRLPHTITSLQSSLLPSSYSLYKLVTLQYFGPKRATSCRLLHTITSLQSSLLPSSYSLYKLVTLQYFGPTRANSCRLPHTITRLQSSFLVPTPDSGYGDTTIFRFLACQLLPIAAHNHKPPIFLPYSNP
ncbi:hypothetical protein J6590_009512 [Homalodisca vitripennis]|nr:hypothetical protein J6590_009512 [Homalodisca vitripennis]